MNLPWQYTPLLVMAALVAIEAGVPNNQIDYIPSGKQQIPNLFCDSTATVQSLYTNSRVRKVCGVCLLRTG